MKLAGANSEPMQMLGWRVLDESMAAPGEGGEPPLGQSQGQRKGRIALFQTKSETRGTTQVAALVEGREKREI